MKPYLENRDFLSSEDVFSTLYGTIIHPHDFSVVGKLSYYTRIKIFSDLNRPSDGRAYMRPVLMSMSKTLRNEV